MCRRIKQTSNSERETGKEGIKREGEMRERSASQSSFPVSPIHQIVSEEEMGQRREVRTLTDTVGCSFQRLLPPSSYTAWAHRGVGHRLIDNTGQAG